MKVLLIVNTDAALYNFRRPIIDALIRGGHEVVSISSEGPYVDKLKNLGVSVRTIKVDRHSTGIASNIALLLGMSRIIRAEKPDIVHSFTHKPAIFGTIAARLAGVPGVFATITGLGTPFIQKSLKYRIIKKLLTIQYKVAIACATQFFFQNTDDLELFVRSGIAPREKALLTNGSGIDLTAFPVLDRKAVDSARALLSRATGMGLDGKVIVLFPARAVREKGVTEFYEAARIVNQVAKGAYVFLHLGDIDTPSASHISKSTIDESASECGVHYLGFKDDIGTYMAAADIVALPSYREGTPRSLIEALACGKAIVTTDAPGCRETVIDGWNGYLCQVGDAKSLAARILQVDDSMLRVVSERARQLCEVKYDAKKLVQVTLRSYSLSVAKDRLQVS